MSRTLAVHVPPWRPLRSWCCTSPALVRSWPPAASSPFRWSTRTVTAVASRPEKAPLAELALAEGPSCIFVGPIETASKDMLEALYLQARDAYYSGRPLIVDDMFDKVELKLRCYGSKSVVKYPRCSLMRQSTYADAEGGGTGRFFTGFGVGEYMDFFSCFWKLGCSSASFLYCGFSL